jgi:hypothetical protein
VNLRRKLLIISLSLISASAFSQTAALKWPPVTRETKPWTRWWWEGSAVDKENLSLLMEQYAKSGLGGMEITAIYGAKGYESRYIDFISPKWIEMLQHTLKEGTRLGLGIDMAQASGWPFGGPWVTADDASKYVAYKTYDLKGGESLSEAVKMIQTPLVRTVGERIDIGKLKEPIASNPDLQLHAFDQVRFEKPMPLQVLMAYSDKGARIDLTKNVDANGRLTWVAPEGTWKLYAAFEGWHGKMVERAGPGGEGYAIDHFSATATKNYLSQFDKAFAGKDLSALRGFFNDSYEVDDAQGQSNWTPAFFSEFKTRRGYDLKDQLPALFGQDTPENNARVLCDYRETISDLLLENYTRLWHTWAKGHGAIIRNQAHGSPANILDLYAATDIPETEGTEVLRLKFASSAAHVTGKKLTSSESTTWQNEHFVSTLADIRKALDVYFLGGVNHIFYHGTEYSPKDAPWPGWLFYAAVHYEPTNSFYDHFATVNQYVTRIQSFMQGGKSANDVLIYFPFYDQISNPSRTMLEHFDGIGQFFNNKALRSNAQTMLDRGYSFDFISDRQILGIAALNKQLVTGGAPYKTIIVPEAKYMPVATLQKLYELAKAGATVIFYKSLPQEAPGAGNIEQKKAAFNAIISPLKFTDTNKGARKADIGTGCFLIGDNIELLLASAGVEREKMADAGLQFARRTNEQGTVYFISNHTDKPVNGWITLTGNFPSVALFDPMTGKSGLVASKATKDSTQVYLNLVPGSSYIVQAFKAAVKAPSFITYAESGPGTELTGEWKLQFIKGGPTLPAPLTISKLGSWTEMGGEDLKKFSGTGSYTLTFAKPAGNASTWILDLGKVYESALVKLNGQPIGTLIGPSYKVEIPASALKASNVLEVQVANLMVNRIIDMDKNKQNYKIFYNTNFPARQGNNRGPDGLFSAANWPVRLSGLAGPVMLYPAVPAK